MLLCGIVQLLLQNAWKAFDGTDEISILVDNLNHMLDEKDEMSEKLRHAQRDLYETELSKQQMQVLAYRNQINPHFLYNTFECIRAMALYYDADEIAEITMALSRIFPLWLLKAHNIVTVEEEIANIREYAKIIFLPLWRSDPGRYRSGGRGEKAKYAEAYHQPLLKTVFFTVWSRSLTMVL